MGTDMRWVGGKWKFRSGSKNKTEKLYRKNTYRVLLTRGRDGFIIFVPNERVLDPVYEILKEAGVKELN